MAGEERKDTRVDEKRETPAQMVSPVHRILAFCPAILCMVIIFLLSAQPAEDSSEVSEFFGEKLLTAANDLFGFGWTRQLIVSLSIEAQHALRKAAHFMEYLLLAECLFFGFKVNLPGAGIRMNRRCVWGIASLSSGILYAASDEIHQLFVPGRSGMLGDVLVDSAGVLTGVLFAMLRNARKMRKQ